MASRFACVLLAMALWLALAGAATAMPTRADLGIDDPNDLGPAAAAYGNASGPKVYIVTYKAGVDVDAATDDLKAKHGLGELFRYKRALKGAALLLPAANKVAAIAADPRVAAIRPDGVASIPRPVTDLRIRGAGTASRAVPAPQVDTCPQNMQIIPPGVIRIGTMETRSRGQGVVVAVLDTGIEFDHPDLAANIHPTLRADFVGDKTSRKDPGGDPHGHGTHMAGTIAGVANGLGVFGVANRVQLVSVRVFNRDATVSTWAQVIAGMDYVVEHADVIKVANMSFGGDADDPDLLHTAIQAMVAGGVTCVVSAGNDGWEVSNIVPARYDEVITVSAYDNEPGEGTDPRGDLGYPFFSNYGPEVDIGAPGVDILSTWINHGYRIGSGTSAATAHVSGAAAMYIASHPGATPAQVRQALIDAGENGYPGQNSTYDPEPLLNVRGF